MMQDPERNARTSRILLFAGAAIAVIAVVSWFTIDSGGKTHPDSKTAGTCQLPSGSRSGTEDLPELLATLTTPLGAPAKTWTKTSSGETIYSYCYNSIDGRQVSDAIGLLAGHGYTQAAGDDPSTQLNFTKDQAKPYGVSLTVHGDLDISRVDPQADGGLAIVWTDRTPSAGELPGGG